MGGMSVMITGASGFIGALAVATARARGHSVVAVVRKESSVLPEWGADGNIRIVVADLTERGAEALLIEAMKSVDVVIHTAASLAGSDKVQAQDTLAGTRALLAAMVGREGAAPRFVLVSSLSVYRISGLASGDTVDERTPLEDFAEARDAYCRGKLAQEDLVRKAAEKHGFPLWLMRPGAVYGPGRVWNAHLGMSVGSLLVQVGAGGEVPVVHVDRCAEALVLAAEVTPKNDAIEICNVVASDLPDRSAFVAAVEKSGWPKRVVRVPFGLLNTVAWVVGYLPERLWLRLPGLLRWPVLDARMRPLRYANRVLRERLGWRQTERFEDAMARALDDA